MQYVVSNIKEFRKARGMTQRELAEKSGISEIAIRKIENKERKNCSIDTIISIYKGLGIKLTLTYECEPTSLGLKYEVQEDGDN